jgi:hypothetical protein
MYGRWVDGSYTQDQQCSPRLPFPSRTQSTAADFYALTRRELNEPPPFAEGIVSVEGGSLEALEITLA